MGSKYGVICRSSRVAAALALIVALIGVAVLLIGIFAIGLATGFMIFGIYCGIMLVAFLSASFGTAMFDTVTVGADALIYRHLGKIVLEVPLRDLEAARCYVRGIAGYKGKAPNALVIAQKGSLPAERRFDSKFGSLNDGWFCCRANKKLEEQLSAFAPIADAEQ